MITIALAAVFGVALGLWLRAAVLALIVAVAVSALVLFGGAALAPLVASQPENAALAAVLQSWSAIGVIGMIAAGAGAVLAALVMSVVAKYAERSSRSGTWNDPVLGRRQKIRYAQALQERPEHLKAESRIDRLMKL